MKKKFWANAKPCFFDVDKFLKKMFLGVATS
jgi:hypothetical protein